MAVQNTIGGSINVIVYVDDAAFVAGVGRAAREGDIYINSTNNTVRHYSGGAWQDAGAVLTDKLMAAWVQVDALDVASVGSKDVTTEVEGAASVDTEQNAPTAAGILTTGTTPNDAAGDAHENYKVQIRDATTKEPVNDGADGEVYGVLSENAGTWTLTFYKADETAFTFGGGASIDFLFAEVFTLSSIPASALLGAPTFGDITGLAGDHNHDDLYYTEGEVDTLLAGKSDTSHTHETVHTVMIYKDGALSTGDGQQPVKVRIPMDGWILEEIDAFVDVAAGTQLSIQIAEMTEADVYFLDTMLATLDFGTANRATFSGPFAGGRDTPDKGHWYRLDIDTVTGTPPENLTVFMKLKQTTDQAI